MRLRELRDEVERLRAERDEAYWRNRRHREGSRTVSKQTAQMRTIIDNAKAGNQAAMKFLKEFIVRLVNNAEEPKAPNEVIFDIAEIVLRHGIEQGRRDAESN